MFALLRASLTCDLRSIAPCRHLCLSKSSLRQTQTLGGDENLIVIQVSVRYILKHKTGKCDLSIFIAIDDYAKDGGPGAV